MARRVKAYTLYAVVFALGYHLTVIYFDLRWSHGAPLLLAYTLGLLYLAVLPPLRLCTEATDERHRLLYLLASIGPPFFAPELDRKDLRLLAVFYVAIIVFLLTMAWPFY